jgi:hypothetical protein
MSISPPSQLMIDAEIEALLQRRAEYRKLAQSDAADEIKRKLWKVYKLKIIDYADDRPSSWVPIRTKPKKATPSVVWSKVEWQRTFGGKGDGLGTAGKNHQYTRTIKLVVCTVDSPTYRARLQDTISHLEESGICNCSCSDQSACRCLHLEPEPCFMLDATKHPLLGIKKIVFEGWRTILLPKLIAQYRDGRLDDGFVLVAEDDIRFPPHTYNKLMNDECSAVFAANPDIDILSFGHSWKDFCKGNVAANLLHQLQKCKGPAPGVHGATLFAIRVPEGLESICAALERGHSAKKHTHLDQYIFHSTHHDLNVALCDPPLVGWAEVNVTLTKSPSGHKKQGGGRRGVLPPPPVANDYSSGFPISWVRRCLSQETAPEADIDE